MRRGVGPMRAVPALGAIWLAAIALGTIWPAALALGLGTWVVSRADAQTQRGRQGPAAAHGDPQGWRFTLPPGGNAARGRAVFEKLECYKCHEMKGGTFPAPSQRDAIGPELTSMARHHSEGFLAESIANPNAFIDKGRGYTTGDGTSKMPSFNDSLTVQDLVDLVAFLKSLSPSAGPAPAGHRH